MEDRSADMQAIFTKLSERNKDIIILIAKSVKVAQEESTEQSRESPKQTA